MAMFGIDRDTVVAAGQRILPAIDRVLLRSAAIEEQPVFPNRLFDWAPDLEANWQTVRDEAQTLLVDRTVAPPVRELSQEHHKIAVDDRWRSFFLWAYGVRIDANCARCPQTARIVERVPGLLTAFYSVMLAGAHVPRHTGPTKAIITAHLGLIIPLRRENCHMQVADRNIVWEEGRLVVFDDMYPHEVWNDTDEDRIVLLLHLKRPLKFPGSMVREMLFAAVRASPFVRDGLRNLERWNEKTDAGGKNGSAAA
jgi:aspartyl/asparaginyl beta-hydroxylase (cupin superfamily)